ncbi:SRPBCC family protein [Thalassomonas viridans]|uniref:SRPBCC family protein n=1 Tax=Thalassomonas viridans TaxID=137584 RepID=A0AAE9YXR8_9GAMM|nr:SRPBCC family protein [Thalassomonas viridans]WDE03171.1 SRPBCC family protein [Thalassomonas viridans]
MKGNGKPGIEICLYQEVSTTPEQLLEILLDHVRLGRFFKARFALVKPEDKGQLPGGKGCIRQVTIGRQQFLEEIISASASGICYQIIGPGPVSEHQGEIVFNNRSGSTLVEYKIRCKGPKWLPDFLVKYVICRDIRFALRQLAGFFQKQVAA